MEIRFTEDELRIIAKLVTEEMQKAAQKAIIDKVLGPYIPAGLADKRICDLVADGDIKMSVGLYNIMQCHFGKYTLRELADTVWIQYGRVKGIGRKKYFELTQLFTQFGLNEGYKKIKYDHATMRYKIGE